MGDMSKEAMTYFDADAKWREIREAMARLRSKDWYAASGDDGDYHICARLDPGFYIIAENVVTLDAQYIMSVSPSTIRALAEERERMKLDRDAFEAKKISLQDDDIPGFLARAEAAEAEVKRLREALECIAGERQCLDDLMGNADIARAALEGR